MTDRLDELDALSGEEWELERQHGAVPRVSPAEAVGRNARRIRLGAGRTLDEVAAAARALGARWTTARVVEFERGARALTVANLLMVQAALSHATEQPVTLPELVGGRYYVDVTPGFSLGGESVREAFNGAPSDVVLEGAAFVLQGKRERDRVLATVRSELGDDVTPREANHAQHGAPPDLAEQRAASSLGVDAMTLRVLAERMWGKSMPSERNARSDGTSPQARGRATRELLAELRAELERVRRGDG